MSRRLAFHLAALALLFLVGVAASATASNCTISIALTPGERVAGITAHHGAAVVFNGNLSFASASGGMAAVALWANASTGWATAVQPGSVTFSGAAQENVSFNVTVMVPPGEPAVNIASVALEATAEVGGQQCASSAAQVIVSPGIYWGGVAVIPMSAFVQLDPQTRDGRVEYEVRLSTNLPRATTVRLVSNGPRGLESDLPTTLLLDEIGPNHVSGRLTVSFHAVSAEARTYRFLLGATQSMSGSSELILMSSVELGLPHTPVNYALIDAVAVGGLASMGVAAWAWHRRRLSAGEKD